MIMGKICFGLNCIFILLLFISEHTRNTSAFQYSSFVDAVKQQQQNNIEFEYDVNPFNTHEHGHFPYANDLFSLDNLRISVSGNSTPPFVVDDICKSYLLAYSTNASEFVHCAVKYARPFRFCGSCVVPYTRAVNLYSDIVQKGGGTCSRQLLNSDRIHVLTKTNIYMQQLWGDSECSRCFTSVTENNNGTVDYEIENKTLIFLDLYNETATCMNVTDEELVDPSRWREAGNSSVCKECQESYSKLNSHFNTILKTSKNHVCMDVVDIMNYTRQMWSEYFHCSNRSGDMVPILCLTAVFCLCPILFYVGNRIHGEPDWNRQKIVKQKRFPRFRRTPSSYGSLPVEQEIIIPPPDTINSINSVQS